MHKRMMIMIIALVVIFGGIFLWNTIKNYAINKYFANFQPPAAVVTAEKAKLENWQPYINAIGTLVAVNGVTVSTQIAGNVKVINFDSGQLVKKGDVIVQLDDSVEQAELQGNKAQVLLTKTNYIRFGKLQEKKYVSQADYDQSIANYEQALANLNKTQAIIDQKHITAPFDGKIGIRQVNLGQYLSPGDAIVSLQALNPLYINFFTPEQNLKSLNLNDNVQIQIDTQPGKTFNGKLTAIDSTVDQKTHNIKLQATIPNDNNYLYPGLFANIQVVLPQQMNVITLPQTAIDPSLFGSSVFVVTEHGKDNEGKPVLQVKRQYVKTGEQRDNKIVILEGIKAGDLVVTSGQLKLDNGARIEIDNSIKTY